MVLRKNRLLQILFGLLLFTFLFPILLNVLYVNTNNDKTGTHLQNSDLPFTHPIVVRFYHQKKKSESDEIDNVDSEQSEMASSINFSPPPPLNLTYAKMVMNGESLDVQLAYRFADLSNRVKYAEMIAGERRQEIYHLLQQIRNLWMSIQQKKNLSSSVNKSTNNEHDTIDSSAIQNDELSITVPNSTLLMLQEELIQIPTLLNLMPYLSRTSIQSFNPAFRIASPLLPKSSQSRRFVFGVPTVKRTVESYLISTLRDLIKNLTPIEREQCIFVVFIAEIDLEFVRKTADDIMKNFQREIDSGLIEIISPPLNYYPNFSQLKQTLGDPIERVRWRSKQNFDFAYLMMYCRSKGTYYVQLEDDIITKPSYLTKIENFIAKNALSNRDWLILDFCSLGFIGKLFRTVDLSHFVLFFIMFHNDKPVDWLLDNYVQTKVCRFDKDVKDCKKRKDSIWITHKPSLFQHIGTHSSLKGKIQKLRDKAFGKMKLFEPHLNNPPVKKYYASIKHYQRYKWSNAYEGSGFFWGVSPVDGDVFGVLYEPPVNLDSCLIKTGNAEHPMDILYNASLQIKPDHHSNIINANINKDGFITIGRFDPVKGSLDIRIPKEMNPVQELRVRVEQNSTNWMIINEILVKELKDDAKRNKRNVWPGIQN